MSVISKWGNFRSLINECIQNRGFMILLEGANNSIDNQI